jgi:NADH:ubiquinone oxidoreductase subunit 3 (subunit A)
MSKGSGWFTSPQKRSPFFIKYCIYMLLFLLFEKASLTLAGMDWFHESLSPNSARAIR